MTVGPTGPGLTPGRPAPTMAAGPRSGPGAPDRFYFLTAKISGKPQTKTGGHIDIQSRERPHDQRSAGPIRAGDQRRPRGHGLEF